MALRLVSGEFKHVKALLENAGIEVNGRERRSHLYLLLRSGRPSSTTVDAERVTGFFLYLLGVANVVPPRDKCTAASIKVMTSSDNRTAFLLGSGVSRPAGLPSVEKLTATILCGNTFLLDLSTRFDSYYQQTFGRGMNYEDLFFVASQLRDELTGEANNPIAATAIETLRSECNFDLPQLSRSLDYISDSVASSLRQPATRLDHLQPLKAAWEEAPLQTLNIFTLNHDLLLEHYFRDQDIPFVHGFDAVIKNVRYWNPTLFDANVDGIRLLKLHGSIDWYRFQPIGSNNWYDEMIGTYQGKYPSDAHAPNDVRLETVDPRPLLLIGSFNKIPEYTRRIFLDLYYEFRRLLDRSTILVSCGYGFADKGINEQILEWLYGDRKRRIVLVEPKHEYLQRRARAAISLKWKDWVKDGTLTIISKGIEEVSWDEVKQA